jgi:hypothetical protein
MLWCRTIACKSDIPIWFGTTGRDISYRKRDHKLCAISWREDPDKWRTVHRRNWAEEMNCQQSPVQVSIFLDCCFQVKTDSDRHPTIDTSIQDGMSNGESKLLFSTSW